MQTCSGGRPPTSSLTRCPTYSSSAGRVSNGRRHGSDPQRCFELIFDLGQVRCIENRPAPPLKLPSHIDSLEKNRNDLAVGPCQFGLGTDSSLLVQNFVATLGQRKSPLRPRPNKLLTSLITKLYEFISFAQLGLDGFGRRDRLIRLRRVDGLGHILGEVREESQLIGLDRGDQDRTVEIFVPPLARGLW